MDYVEQAALKRHLNWQSFLDFAKSENSRLVLASTKAATPYTQFQFQHGDILLFGRESSGVPDDVHNQADARILVPMAEGRRSLNLAVCVGMLTGEALRQIGR